MQLATTELLRNAVTAIEGELQLLEARLEMIISDIVSASSGDVVEVMIAFEAEMHDVCRRLSNARSDLRKAQVESVH